MNTDEFWQLIEATHQESGGDPEKQADLLVKALVNMPVDAILDYQRIQDGLENRAYRGDLWNAAYLIGEGCGDDGFMDFRAWLIAQGRKVYEDAIQDPETLAELVSVERRFDTQWEGLLYVGGYAYEQKTNTQDGIPISQELPSLDETHPLTDDDDELKTLYPKLWAKFGW